MLNRWAFNNIHRVGSLSSINYFTELKKKFVFSLFLCSALLFNLPELFSQKNALTSFPDSSHSKKHSPVTATLLSAVVPGLGQVYNRKYWKVPVVYGGLITAGYFLKMNRDLYREKRTSYIAAADTDSTTISNSNLPVEGLASYMEYYRKQMEISYIALGLVYVLNIVDATVDAHLFTFDVSDDLSLRIMPEIHSFSNKEGYAGIRMTLRL